MSAPFSPAEALPPRRFRAQAGPGCRQHT